jgi:hypothetical protein
MQHRRPWYGILYYLLGAQGSFFAWILAVFGLFISWGEAILFAANRRPHPSTVAQVLADPPWLKRWVELRGVEVDLDRLAALAGDPTDAPSDTVLIDEKDPAAIALARALGDLRGLQYELQGVLAQQRRLPVEVHRVLAQAAADLRALGQRRIGGWGSSRAPWARPGAPRARARAALVRAASIRSAFGAAVAKQDSLLKELDDALLDLERDLAAGHLWPAQALVVFSDAPRLSGAPAMPAAPVARTAPSEAGPSVGPAAVAAPADSLPGMVTRWRQRVEVRLRRLEEAVRVGAVREGMLTPLPASRIDASKRRYGTAVGAQYLVVGHRPNEIAFVMGLVSVVAVGLLAAGLFALRSPVEGAGRPVAPALARAGEPEREALAAPGDIAEAPAAAHVETGQPTEEVVGT